MATRRTIPRSNELAITGEADYFSRCSPAADLKICLSWIYIKLPNNMATKKTATKTTASAEETPKPVAKKAAKKAAAKKASPAATPAAAKKAAAKPSLDAIARAAYLNYRRRVELGLPGNSHGDWLEAERQSTNPS